MIDLVRMNEGSRTRSASLNSICMSWLQSRFQSGWDRLIQNRFVSRSAGTMSALGRKAMNGSYVWLSPGK